MSDDTVEPFLFPVISGKKVTAAFDGGRITWLALSISARNDCKRSS